MNVALVLAVGWVGVLGAVLVRLRPQPVPRALALLPERRLARHLQRPRAGAPTRTRIDLPSRRALMVGAVVAVGIAVVLVPAGLAVMAAVFLRPVVARRGAEQAVAVAVERNVAEVVTLIALAVSAGHNLTGALKAATARGEGPVELGIQQALRRVDRGERLADALESLPATLGEPVRPVVAALVS